MSKNKIVKFMIDDEVTFINEFEEQMFGFFYINDIIYHKETIKYQLYKLTNGLKELIEGYYDGDKLSKIQSMSNNPQHHHNNNKVTKKKQKSKKVKSKVKIELIIGYRLNDKLILLRTKDFTSIDYAWKAILKKYPNAKFQCAQMIS